VFVGLRDCIGNPVEFFGGNSVDWDSLSRWTSGRGGPLRVDWRANTQQLGARGVDGGLLGVVG